MNPGGRNDIIESYFRLGLDYTEILLYLVLFHGITLRRLERVFCWSSVCETMKDFKERFLMVQVNFMSPWTSIIGLYFKGAYDVISATMATPTRGPLNVKRPSKCQFLEIIWKTNLVTHCFYFFVEKLPKLFTFSGSMKKNYVVAGAYHKWYAPGSGVLKKCGLWFAENSTR